MSENGLSIKGTLELHGRIVFSSEVKEAVEKTRLLPTVKQVALIKLIEKLIDQGFESAEDIIPKIFDSISNDVELSNIFNKIIESIT